MKKWLVSFMLLFPIFFFLGCSGEQTTEIINLPKLIDVRSAKPSELSPRKLSQPSDRVMALEYDDTVMVGESPSIIIVCENSQKDVFVDVEIADSYYPDTIFSYSGDSDEYKARVTTSMNTTTNIWTTTITIAIPKFLSKEDRAIEVVGVNFLRQIISQSVEAELPESVNRSVLFSVDQTIHIGFYYEVIFFECYYFIDKRDMGVGYVLLDTDNGQVNTSEWNSAYADHYEDSELLIPAEFLEEDIFFMQISLPNTMPFKVVLTSLDYSFLYIDVGTQPVYCTFGSNDTFLTLNQGNGSGELAELTASEIFEIHNMTNIVYNYIPES